MPAHPSATRAHRPADTWCTGFGRTLRRRALVMPVLFAVLAWPGSATAWDLGVGRSSRPGNYDLSLHAGPLVLEFIDEGRQPDSIANRNRVFNIDARWQSGGRLSGFVEAGLSSSRWSHNGSGNGYRWARGLQGRNVGCGVEWAFHPGWALRLQTLWLRYPQSSEPSQETFTYTSLALLRTW